jgi:hypothetical protein
MYLTTTLLDIKFQKYIQGILEGDYERNLTRTSPTAEGILTKTSSYALFQKRVRAILKYAEYKLWYKRLFF